MSRIDQLKQELRELSAEELKAVREWLDELEEQLFDDKLARDDAAGKLDKMAERALDNLRAGRVRDL